MGVQLEMIVSYVRETTRGVPAVDLARLNLRVGRALSRNATSIPDEPELVEHAWRCAREIVGGVEGGVQE
ncbi:MAG: hypothetical protein IT372_33025 [Polyangiaceae bacterium]|nr:hypothetical protein [Polyangiaceae bacterium]